MTASSSWHRRLGHRLTTVEARQAPWTVALRNAAGVTLPLAVGLVLGHTGAGLAMAVGALTVMFSDQPGPYALRLKRLLLASAAGALAALVGFSLGAETAVVLPLVCAWVFVACLLVALGPAATRVGLTSIIVLLITSSRHELGPALSASGLIFAGGAFQTLLAVLSWPFDRHRPQRQMLASALDALALAVRGAADNAAPPPESATINNLQADLVDRNSQRSSAEERFFVVVREYDQIRLALVAMEQSVDRLDAAARALLQDWADDVARVLELAAESSRHPRTLVSPSAAVARMNAGVSHLQRQLGGGDATPAARELADAVDKLARHVRVVARNCRSPTGAARSATGTPAAPPVRLQTDRPGNILRANLDWHSTAFRHALRCTFVVTASLALVRWLDIPHGYWLPMTTAIVLKPDFSATVVTGVLRMAGTLVGLLLMSLLLAYVLQSEIARIASMGVLCFAFRDFAPRHYGIGITALSGMLVLMLALAGEPAMPVVVTRALATSGGCIVALAAYLAWPSWERRRVHLALAGMLEGWSEYLDSLRRDDQTTHGSARRNARARRSDAQASLQRLRQEPRTGEGLLANGEAFLIAGNRLARAAMQLDALLLQQPDLRAHPSLQALLEALARHTHELGARLHDTHLPYPPPAATRNIDTLAAALDDGAPHPALPEIGERFRAITATLDSIVAELEPSRR